MINKKERELVAYLIKLSNQTISEHDRVIVDSLFNVVNDIERVGDHAENIAELAVLVIDRELDFSEDALNDIAVIREHVIRSLDTALKARETGDLKLVEETSQVESQVDMIEKNCSTSHIARLNKNVCYPESGIMFLDLCSNMERVSDHALNIANSILDEK